MTPSYTSRTRYKITRSKLYILLMGHKCNNWKLYLIIIFIVIFFITNNSLNNEGCNKKKIIFKNTSLLPQYKFQNYNNNVMHSQFLIPNIVHFVRFKQPEITFVDAACIISAVKNQRPDIIYFHTDSHNFTGKYWKYLLDVPQFRKIYKINRINIPNTIFGQRFNKRWHLSHASDVTRIRVLMQYGGIFLDNDSYVVRNLDIFRRFEMVLGWDDYYDNLGTQVLLANSNARFLKLWLEFYRNNYKNDSWYFNAGKGPSDYILKQNPSLVLNVSTLFGVQNLGVVLYNYCWKDWTYMFTIHFLINHRYYLDRLSMYFPTIDEENVFYLNSTAGEILRITYLGKNYIRDIFKSNKTFNCFNPV